MGPRKVTNISTHNDAIYVDGINVVNVNVAPHKYNNNNQEREHFTMDNSGVAFSYYDLIILIIFILIFCYLLG